MRLRAGCFLLLAACQGGGPPPPECGSAPFSVFSPCGFESITTTCGTGVASCEDAGAEAFCSVGTVTKDCTIQVVLGDGTQHTVSVTLGPSSDPACQGVMVVTTPTPTFTSSTCMLPAGDAGVAD